MLQATIKRNLVPSACFFSSYKLDRVYSVVYSRTIVRKILQRVFKEKNLITHGDFQQSFSSLLFSVSVSFKWLLWAFLRSGSSVNFIYQSCIQKQPSRGVLTKGLLLKICSRFTGEHPRRSVISILLQSKAIEITLWHGYSSVNIAAYFQSTFS